MAESIVQFMTGTDAATPAQAAVVVGLFASTFTVNMLIALRIGRVRNDKETKHNEEDREEQ